MDPRQVDPPRLAERLLRAVLPRGAQGLSILGDLRQEMNARPPHARAGWYWRQAIPLLFRYVPARLRALRAFRPGGLMFGIWSDVRQALRVAWKTPAQTTIVVLTLALAIGATTVGFAFADLVVLRGMPVDDEDTVVYLFGVDPRTASDRAPVDVADFREYRARAVTVEKLAAISVGRAALMDRGIATSIDVGWATADYFAAFGQTPLFGRTFLSGDDTASAPPVAVLSHRYWRDVLGADPSALGRTVQIGRTTYTIVGVARPELEVGNLALIDMWLPLVIDPAATRPGTRARVTGRLKDGVTFAAAAAEFAAIGDALAREFPETNTGWRARLVPIREAIGGPNLWVVMALFLLAIAFILAIACANIANLLLVRATARRREMALRAALGAPRARIVRQLIVEGLVTSTLAGALGVPIAEGMLRAIRSIDAEPVLKQLWLDGHELAFVTAAVLIGPLLFSLAPALASVRLDLRAELGAGGARAGSSGGRLRGALVVSQMALAVVLLTASALAVRSAININNLDLGFDPAPLLGFELALDEPQYPDAGAVAAGIAGLRRELATVPGVTAVAVVDRMPIVTGYPTVTLGLATVRADGDAAPPWALAGHMLAGSATAMGLPVLAGREFTPEESERGTAVALLNQQAAERYFGSAANALGRAVTVTMPRGAPEERTVVGVVGGVREDETLDPQVWMPLAGSRRVAVLLRAAGAPSSLGPEVRAAAARALPDTALEGLEPFSATYHRSRASDYVVIGVLAAFALLALALAAAGLYGVIAYAANLRTSEFGTRLALGATGMDLLGLVARGALTLLAMGLGLGTAGGMLVAQGMRGTLVGVSPHDPLTFGGIALTLTVVTALASCVPAWRAAHVDVVQALRAE